ncbi:MAG TPA: ATP-binding protein [Methylomirabilota bacterium]|nr:ATP-binding protein [Methylomirabilota bacterium]
MIQFFQLISIGAAVLNLLLAFFLLTRQFRSSLNRTYFLWGTSIAVWNIGVFFMFRVKDVEAARFWARFVHMGVIFLPVSLFHLALLVAQVRKSRWICGFYGLQIAFALLNFTPLFIADAKHVGYAWYSVAGPIYWLFMPVYSAAAVGTLAALNIRRTQVFPLHRARLHSLMLAAALLIAFGLNDILPILGIYTYPGTNSLIYPLGSLAAIFYGGIVSYSVLQHQLLNVHVTLGKVAAYLVRMFFFLLIGFSLLMVAAILFPKQLTMTGVGISLAVIVLSGSLASVLFPRLFGTGNDSFERRLLGDRFEYHDKIQDFVRSIPLHGDTNNLLQNFHDLLVNTVRIQSYHIILLDESSRKFSLFHSHPERHAAGAVDFAYDAPIFEVFRNERIGYLPFKQVYTMPVSPEAIRIAQAELALFDPEICFPFQSDEGPLGLLLLGPKAGGEPYTANDLYMFDLLVKSLAIVMNQIRLKNKVLQAEEMELLGRMSRGMAHDLNNLLTPVSTFLQLCASGRDLSRMPTELLQIAVRNVGTIKDYIQEALFFSQTQTAQFKFARLDLLIERVVQSFQASLDRKAITTTVEVPGEISIEMDEVLIQRLLSNLVSNSLDASPHGSTIRIVVEPLTLSGDPAEWQRIQVIDEGAGISPENLKRVLRPYFTTKIHGDETRGVGLGLAISQKIVQLHGGDLSITSEENKGTTVQVDLPCVQAQGRPAATAHLVA